MKKSSRSKHTADLPMCEFHTFPHLRQLSEDNHTADKSSIRTGFSFQLYDAVQTWRTRTSVRLLAF